MDDSLFDPTAVSEHSAHETYGAPAGPASAAPPGAAPGEPEHMKGEPVPPAPERPGRGIMRAGCTGALVAVLVASIVGLFAGYSGARFALQQDRLPQAVSVIESSTEEPVAAVAAKALPSVVNIEVTAVRQSADGAETLPKTHPDVPSITGNGSGVAYWADDEGGTYIVTNDHVVANATRIVVTDVTGERHDGVVVGTDVNTDIAVVFIEADLPVIDIGDSDDLAVGDLVVAIGSPFGLEQSVSSGVVSAIGRSLTTSSGGSGIYPLVDVIQTDAAINPGNSGGALCDRAGRLVGINTAIFSDSGVNERIGFAIPVASVVRVADEIIDTGTAEYPFLGIVGQTVTEQLAEAEDLPVDEGALVIDVTEGTGAERGGITGGDIIVGYEGDPIRSMDDLILAVRRTAIGDTVTLDIWRAEELVEVDITVGPKPDTLDPSREETVPEPETDDQEE